MEKQEIRNEATKKNLFDENQKILIQEPRENFHITKLFSGFFQI